MHVDDHCAGIEAALLSGDAGETYNLAPPAESEEFTHVVIERVRQLVGRGEITPVGDRDNYDLRYWMDASKAKECLGWTAKMNLTDTLEDTVRWYLDNPEWMEAANMKLAGSLSAANSVARA